MVIRAQRANCAPFIIMESAPNCNGLTFRAWQRAMMDKLHIRKVLIALGTHAAIPNRSDGGD